VERLKDQFQGGMTTGFGRIMNQDLFLFLLDLEVKRARRYQNFLCLMLLKIKIFPREDNGGDLQTCNQTLGHLLMEETRESDVIGSLGLNKLVVLLPYADMKMGGYVKSRFEDILKYYDFRKNGFDIMVDQICFPIHGTDTTDLIKKALGTEQN
jgi:PleD family two-component response regulator